MSGGTLLAGTIVWRWSSRILYRKQPSNQRPSVRGVALPPCPYGFDALLYDIAMKLPREGKQIRGPSRGIRRFDHSHRLANAMTAALRTAFEAATTVIWSGSSRNGSTSPDIRGSVAR